MGIAERKKEAGSASPDRGSASPDRESADGWPPSPDRKRRREPPEEASRKKQKGAQKAGSSTGKQSWMFIARARALLKELRSYMLPQRFCQQLKALLGQASLFGVAPSKITVEQFKKRYGMIQQVPRAMPPYNRFNRNNFRVREDTLRVVGSCVLKDVYISARHLGFPRQEKSSASIFSRLLCVFALFMRYKPECEDSQQGPEFREEELREDESESNESESDESDERDEAIFLDMEFPDDDGDADYQPTENEYVTSSKEEQVEFEASEEEPDPFQLRCYSDILAFTTSHSGIRTLKLAVDIKTVVKHRDLLQVFMYVDGHTKGTSSLGKEARLPVYLHAMDTREWRYGISEIDGYVEVEGNELLESSLHSFPESPMEPLSKEFTSSFTKQEVRDKFRSWRASLLSERIVIPDGLYPVGRFYYCTKALQMPGFERSFEALPMGALKLYSGWLYILIGERVSRWTPNKVWKRVLTHEYAHRLVSSFSSGASN